jgi:hypothetical protein
MYKKQLMIILIIVASLLVGCASERAPEVFSDQAYDSAGAPKEPFEIEAEEIGAGGVTRSNFGGEAAPIQPLVIRNASLRTVVEDPSESTDQISSLAETMGGFVVSSNVYQTTYGSSDIPTTRASITIRVPAERLDEAIDKIVEDAIEVQERNVSGQDVTSEYTDLQSRLTNLEAAEEQLREIMEAAAKTEDVLQVFENLRQVRSEIEVIKGQMKYYEDSARLSSISIDLIPDELAQPLSIGGWHPEGTARDAVETLINTLQFLADAGIWLVICVAPILLILGVPAYFIVRSVRRRRLKSQVEDPEVKDTSKSE